MKFVPPVAGKRLEGHVFLNLSIGIYTPCEHRCVMEKECVSVNIGPTINNKVVCELSDSDAIKHPGDLKQRNGWTYRGTEVRNAKEQKISERENYKEVMPVTVMGKLTMMAIMMIASVEC